MLRKIGFNLLLICFVLLFNCSCSQKNSTIAAMGTIIGDPTAAGEKMFFPVFVEELGVIARLDSISVHELVQKGDQVKISLIDFNYAKRINAAPIANLIKRIETEVKPRKNEGKQPTAANIFEGNIFFLFYKILLISFILQSNSYLLNHEK